MIEQVLNVLSEEYPEIDFASSEEMVDSGVLDSLTITGIIADSLMGVSSNEEHITGKPIFDWGEEDFNFNVPYVKFQEKVILQKKEDSNSTVLAAEEGGLVRIRPNGYEDEDTETIFRANGEIVFPNGSIVRNSDSSILHTDTGRLMNASAKVNLTGDNRLEKQLTGYVCVWYQYTGSDMLKTHVNFTYIPKGALDIGQITAVLIAEDGKTMGAKTLYIEDDGTTTTLTGAAPNSAAAPNNGWVLRYVLSY